MSSSAADEGPPAQNMPSNDHDGLAGVLLSSTPSTAASLTETIDSTEDVHDFDEWELFSDTNSEDGTSDDEVAKDKRCSNNDDEELARRCHSIIDNENCSVDPTESTPVLEESLPGDASRSTTTSLLVSDTLLYDEDVASDSSGELVCLDGPEQACNQALVAHQNQPDACQSGDSVETSLCRRIQVVVRVRPPLDSEGKVVVTTGENEGTSLCVQATNTQGSISTVTACTFDRVFMGTATQEDIFSAVEASVQACLEGYNATVFAYGQTGTGKTHTLFGSDLVVSNDNKTSGVSAMGENDSARAVKSSWGIVPRTLSYLLDQTNELKTNGTQVDLQLSFLQIYNDRLFDLLTDRMRQKPLLIREQPALDGSTNVTVQGLSSDRITSFSSAMQIIHQGHMNRCVRETESNLSSSRSHAIVQLHVTTHCFGSDGVGKLVRKARLNLVDLAGSEKWNTDVDMEDAHSQELKNINTSLSALGNCIAALTEAGRKHIPYRDSTLTRVLQDSFGGNTQSCLIATINATQQSSEETIRTLHFADRARSVMQTIRVNEMTDGSTELLMAKVQIAKLRERLESEQRRRHETRLKEHQSLQRDYQEKLKGKEKEVRKLSQDNAVFQRWREEDTKKIRALESHVKDLELLIDSNDNRFSEKESPGTTTNPSTEVPKRRSLIPPPVAAKNASLEKSGSRTNLVQTGSVNSRVARTYKQVLERYALGPNKEHHITVQPSKIAYDTTELNDSPNNATNQYGDSLLQPRVLSTSLQDNQRKMWVTQLREDCGGQVSGNNSDVAQQYPASGLCISPVTCPSNNPQVDGSSLIREPKSSWAFNNLASTPSNHNNEWTNSVLSRSTPAIFPQKQSGQDGEKNSELWSQNEVKAGAPALKIELLKSVSLGAFSTLPQASPAMASISNKAVIAPCQRHKLAGCMLCTVTEESSRQSLASVVHQIPKEAKVSAGALKLIEVVRRPQDGPCERHQLLRCFICMKGSASSSTISLSVASVTAPSMNSSSGYHYGTSVNASSADDRCSQPTRDFNSKCALHALDNCILCAGVKAMTRKMTAPVQASPSKTTNVFSLSMRNLSVSEDHLADRQRRYTLDERILNYQTPARTHF